MIHTKLFVIVVQLLCYVTIVSTLSLFESNDHRPRKVSSRSPTKRTTKNDQAKSKEARVEPDRKLAESGSDNPVEKNGVKTDAGGVSETGPKGDQAGQANESKVHRLNMRLQEAIAQSQMNARIKLEEKEAESRFQFFLMVIALALGAACSFGVGMRVAKKLPSSLIGLALGAIACFSVSPFADIRHYELLTTYLGLFLVYILCGIYFGFHGARWVLLRLPKEKVHQVFSG
jgi:hypothetical protein